MYLLDFLAAWLHDPAGPVNLRDYQYAYGHDDMHAVQAEGSCVHTCLNCAS